MNVLSFLLLLLLVAVSIAATLGLGVLVGWIGHVPPWLVNATVILRPKRRLVHMPPIAIPEVDNTNSSVLFEVVVRDRGGDVIPPSQLTHSWGTNTRDAWDPGAAPGDAGTSPSGNKAYGDVKDSFEGSLHAAVTIEDGHGNVIVQEFEGATTNPALGEVTGAAGVVAKDSKPPLED